MSSLHPSRLLYQSTNRSRLRSLSSGNKDTGAFEKGGVQEGDNILHNIKA